MKSLTVVDMAREALTSRGLGGLVHVNGECACKLDDLAPCGDMRGDCVGGRVESYPDRECPCGDGCDFHVVEGR